MSTTADYLQSASAYADGVRELLSAPGAAAGERGGSGPVSYPAAAAAAEALDAASKDLTALTARELEAETEEARQQAATRLLAKALTDLEVSARLLQLAMDQEDAVALEASATGERSASSLSAVDEWLDILTGDGAGLELAAERGGGAPADLPAARAALSAAVLDALDLISERAARSGQKALAGLLGLGVGELARAAGMVGGNLAAAIGQAERAAPLLASFAGFAGNAYASIEALLGPQLTQVLATQVTSWVDELRQGERFGRILERLYQTEATTEALQPLLAGSQADLEAFQAALTQVEGLEAAYGKQIELAEKVLGKMKFLAGVPVVVLPQGQLLVAAIYIVLGGYIIAAGGDHLDAPRLERLSRVEGVRGAIESRLGAAAEGAT